MPKLASSWRHGPAANARDSSGLSGVETNAGEEKAVKLYLIGKVVMGQGLEQQRAPLSTQCDSVVRLTTRHR